jgi:cell filamentation protein
MTTPNSGFKPFIVDLAERHGITYARTRADEWAESVTRLSDDDVQLDDVELLAAALTRAGVITGHDMTSLLAGYWREESAVEEKTGNCAIIFDPFHDYSSKGYLRNHAGLKHPELVKRLEHGMFMAKLPEALSYLATQKAIDYQDFLMVHQILFSGVYPWAGRDRSEFDPPVWVEKATLRFAPPSEMKRAVNYGLQLGQDKRRMKNNPAEVMGLFAYGHPFLDGNGRTMMVVHSELCSRAGLSIAWEKTSGRIYLEALTEEIERPGKGALDAYLAPFKGD